MLQISDTQKFGMTVMGSWYDRVTNQSTKHQAVEYQQFNEFLVYIQRAKRTFPVKPSAVFLFDSGEFRKFETFDRGSGDPQWGAPI